jgi:hypothetical protein
MVRRNFMDIDLKELERILKKQMSNSSFLNLLLEQCLKIDEKLYPVLNTWIKDQTVEDIEIEGYTIQRIMNLSKENFIGALLFADRLIKHPITTKEKLKRLERNDVGIKD